MKTKNQNYDLIGDTHGYADTLRALLDKLGYVESGGFYDHPERTVIFLGDFIDRGPKIRETLQIVKAMTDAGTALAVMGNRYDVGLLAPPDADKDPRHAALNILIKGPEIPTPGGVEYGEGRKEMRVKWWLNDRPLTYRNAALQVPFELPLDPLTAEETRKVCGYPADAPPIFFGHYGFLKPAEPISPNVACIDLGVTRGGPLCAYRWDGEAVLNDAKFVTVARVEAGNAGGLPNGH